MKYNLYSKVQDLYSKVQGLCSKVQERERSEAEAGAKRTLRRFEMGYPPLAPPHQHPARSRQLHHTGVAGIITAERQREDARKRLALRLLTPRLRLRMG